LATPLLLVSNSSNDPLLKQLLFVMRLWKRTAKFETDGEFYAESLKEIWVQGPDGVFGSYVSQT
jgi:hypothetical protein